MHYLPAATHYHGFLVVLILTIVFIMTFSSCKQLLVTKRQSRVESSGEHDHQKGLWRIYTTFAVIKQDPEMPGGRVSQSNLRDFALIKTNGEFKETMKSLAKSS